MKVKLAKNWPAIRQITYSLAAAALAVAAMLGYLTDSEVAAWLETLGKWLGFAGLLVAGLYVKRGAPAPEPDPEPEQEISALDVIERIRAEGADRLGETLRAQADGVRAEFERVRAESPDRLDQFGDGVRAELERRLRG
ncbi:hypothetical protein [Rhodococcus ruber]|uniref:hypothetical protein n=1 Tax=Rhodococcus ruber TaxID=1830 RepID=UPI003783BE84